MRPSRARPSTRRGYAAIPCPAAQAGPRGPLEGRLAAGDGRNLAARSGKRDSPAKVSAHSRSWDESRCSRPR